MVLLVNHATGTLAQSVKIQHTRQLTLDEVLAPSSTVAGVSYARGSLELLVNNDDNLGMNWPDFSLITSSGIIV